MNTVKTKPSAAAVRATEKIAKLDERDITKLGPVIIDAEFKELREALTALEALYIANRGTKHEFVKCITPAHALDLTKKQREHDPVWRAWDLARAALSRTEGGE